MASTPVILSSPNNWEQWYEDTIATVPRQMQKYFKPDTVAVLDEPEPPAKPVDEPAPDGVEAPQVRKARLERNHRQEDVYFKLYNVYQHESKAWEEFNRVDAKLRERILTTVAPQKKATLRGDYTVRKWLTDLQAKTSLPLENRRQNLISAYNKFMGDAHLGWPPGGPALWIAKWEELLNQAERYDEPQRTWL